MVIGRAFAKIKSVIERNLGNPIWKLNPENKNVENQFKEERKLKKTPFKSWFLKWRIGTLENN